jgi:hypothetical protein
LSFRQSDHRKTFLLDGAAERGVDLGRVRASDARRSNAAAAESNTSRAAILLARFEWIPTVPLQRLRGPQYTRA